MVFTFQYVSIISRSGQSWQRTCFNLHSNMFLLFLAYANEACYQWIQFTFQYVSIISTSTKKKRRIVKVFTFQYVSIISCSCKWTCSSWKYLHSNMFLLFQIVAGRWMGWVLQFTFQYVSIISKSKWQSNRIILIYIPICFYYFT